VFESLVLHRGVERVLLAFMLLKGRFCDFLMIAYARIVLALKLRFGVYPSALGAIKIFWKAL